MTYCACFRSEASDLDLDSLGVRALHSSRMGPAAESGTGQNGKYELIESVAPLGHTRALHCVRFRCASGTLEPDATTRVVENC